MTRVYVAHRWVDDYCMVCGIDEDWWLERIEDSPMIEWDCFAITEHVG